MFRSIHYVALAAIAALSFADAHAANAGARDANGYDKFAFALIGDTPYREPEKFEFVLDAINAAHNIAFVLHAGDIKTGSSVCSDELFADRLERFNRFKAPFVITPGDNEWTDCHRVAAGQYQPLERLAKFRDMFYPRPGLTLGATPMTVAMATQASDPRYAEFVEHLRWTWQHVTFATLHMVGSHNGLNTFDPDSSTKRTQADDDEVARRIAASLAWIRDTFAQAKSENARGVLFLFQADPNFDAAPGSTARKGFDAVLTALKTGAIAFARPVLLAHGDSHYMRVDQHLRINGTTVPNLTRVETFGDQDYHWLRVVVEPNSAGVFTVYREYVDDNL